jgi:hypothetical protein
MGFKRHSFRINDILVWIWIRIRGYMSLTNGYLRIREAQKHVDPEHWKGMTSTLGGCSKMRRNVIGTTGTSSLVMGGRYQTSQTIAQLVIIFITYASIPF